MKFISTRGGVDPTPLDVALAAGLAPDGGLYVPESVPTSAMDRAGTTLAHTAQKLLEPYFGESRLREALPVICEEAFDFPAALQPLASGNAFALELFHGPTAAFKDYAARFLAGSLARLRDPASAPTTILVATSGDTGAAVGAAFHRRPGFNVVILYPHGRVSPRQAHGLECFGDNVRTFRVDGSFDDCQRMVKQALGDESLRAHVALSSANSISLGRLLPQMAYYAHNALAFHESHGEKLNFIVPTGNLGNAVACWLARRMGLPIGDIVLGSNANDVLPRYFGGDEYAPRSSIATLANAMDVGAPSNFERLRWWHSDDAGLRAAMRAFSVDDEAIRGTIREAPQRHGVIACPHTAVGLRVLERLREAGDTKPWAVAATAHPAKFESIVEPLVGHAVEPPPALAAWLACAAKGESLAADYAALRAQLA